MGHSSVPFMEQHPKRIEFCNDPVVISDKDLQRSCKFVNVISIALFLVFFSISCT
jgi:hypothetical protein